MHQNNNVPVIVFSLTKIKNKSGHKLITKLVFCFPAVNSYKLMYVLEKNCMSFI